MKKFISILVVLTMVLGLWTVSAFAESPEREASPAWVGELEQAQDAQQLFVVAAVGPTTAYVSLHEKDENGAWMQLMSTPGYIGKHGLGKQAEGDGRTPVGTFSFNAAFGIAEDPGCAIPYRQVTEDDYWSGDQREGYGYNRMVSIRDLPDLNTDDSERIVDYRYQYQYCLNISYNAEGTPGLGSAIFLHCLGPVKPYTGGCVAIPKDQMLTVMQNVRPDCVVVIDSMKTLCPELWESLGLEPEEAAPAQSAEVSGDWPFAVDYGSSELFTQRSMDRAIALVMEEFDSWEGCEMHAIRYAGDACNSEENLRWLNSLGEGNNFTQCMEFLSDFHSPKEAYGAWNPDAEYIDWSWWLACSEDGDWQLLNWGY